MKKSINSKRAIIEHLRLKVRKLLNEGESPWYRDFAEDQYGIDPDEGRIMQPSDDINIRKNTLGSVKQPDGSRRHFIQILDERGRGEGQLDREGWARATNDLTDHEFHKEGQDYVASNVRALHGAGLVTHVEVGNDTITDPAEITDMFKDGEFIDDYYGSGKLVVHLAPHFDPKTHLDKYGNVNVEKGEPPSGTQPTTHPE